MQIRKIDFDNLSEDQIKALQAMPPEDIAYSHLMAYAALQHRGYKVAPHNKKLGEYLMAVEAGEITRLMVFMPPRHGKTRLASELFPAWYIGRNPGNQIITSTYSFDRAGDIGRSVRDQLIDPLHQKIFPECVISQDSKSINKFMTTKDGIYVSVGIGGAITGRGADLFLIDDPIKGREEAESASQQRKIRDWFTSVAYTRLMTTQSAIILIMTRWSFYDLAGFLLDEKKDENWTILNLPAIAEDDNDDIGRKAGEALWPEQFHIPRLKKIRYTVGTRDWNSLYQQRPLPEEGGMVQLDWFNRYTKRELLALEEATRNKGSKEARAVRVAKKMRGEDPPEYFKQIVCSWDTAFKEAQINDPSAGTVWGITETGLYLLWIFNKQVGFPGLKKEVIRMHARQIEAYKLSPAQVPVLIEDKASGQSLIQELKKNTRIPVIPISADANKIVRLQEVTAMIEAGRVYLPERAHWLVEYETQLCHFPHGKHDDLVDSTSQFLRWAGKPKYVRSGNRYWK